MLPISGRYLVYFARTNILHFFARNEISGAETEFMGEGTLLTVKDNPAVPFGLEFIVQSSSITKSEDGPIVAQAASAIDHQLWLNVDTKGGTESRSSVWL